MAAARRRCGVSGSKRPCRGAARPLAWLVGGGRPHRARGMRQRARRRRSAAAHGAAASRHGGVVSTASSLQKKYYFDGVPLDVGIGMRAVMARCRFPVTRALSYRRPVPCQRREESEEIVAVRK